MGWSNYFKGLERTVRAALAEDIGRGDITTRITIPEGLKAQALILAKEDFILCGLPVCQKVFKAIDKNIDFSPLKKDGDKVKAGAVLARIEGRASAILAGERTALNFLSLLSGVATKTNQFVSTVKPYKAKIMDTRKTIPGLRLLQKYAVRVGGGRNHRFSLDEMVLIKDNHLKICGGRRGGLNLPYGCALARTRRLRVEIEVKTLKEFRQAIKLKPDIIMLDNMRIANMRKAVRLSYKLQAPNSRLRTKLEASGGINLKNVKAVASTGVDFISVGNLTHSIHSPDISLEMKLRGAKY